jgi:hypothetical protein
VGKRVDIKLGSKVVEIYLDSQLIKTHPRGGRGQRVTDWNDYPPEKAAFFQRTPAWYRQQASGVGPSTRQTVDTLLGGMPCIIYVNARGYCDLNKNILRKAWSEPVPEPMLLGIPAIER